MNSKLTPLQKKDLIQICRRAWKYQAETVGATDLDFDAWRAQECRRLAKVDGLTSARQSDYCTLRAGFHDLAGEIAPARHWEARAKDEECRQLRWHLGKRLKGALLLPEYAEEIARDQFGAPVSRLTRDQLVALTATVTARIRQRSAAR